MNEITIDLKGIKTKDQVLVKIGESLEFGNWGMNWDALNDSLEYLDTGGIDSTGKKFELPMKIIFENSQELQKNDYESFNTLKEIFGEKDGRIKTKFNLFKGKTSPCPCCGSQENFEDSDYAICTVCNWENDPIQLADPDYVGGANNLSLNQAKEKYKADSLASA